MTAVNTNPFPGLRPFRKEEEYLFFGRESQVDAIVDKLSAARFLAVIGTSGCGKSSLVNCGLRPALHRGLMTAAGSSWRMAQFRPGGGSISALAAALAKEGVLFSSDAVTAANVSALSMHDIVDTTLRLSKLGLIDIVEQARLPEDTNVLLVVDQFEELFRYRQVRSARADATTANDDALALVNLLLEAKAHPESRIYVVLTMRSDFLGDCTHFPGLAEAINTGQYLVPRLTRDERRSAIAGPVGVGGATISPLLLTRLVNDVGDNPDQLSILQHALNRTWARWARGEDQSRPLDLEHYEAIGTMAHALDQHAERAFGELPEGRPRQICERVFKALTDKAADPRGVRRPTSVATLLELATCSDEGQHPVPCTLDELKQVLDVFRKPSRSFVMPPSDETLSGDSIIDISHESLMRVWERLAKWADEEAQSASGYRRLAETATLHGSGLASLWRDPELQLALDWRRRAAPNRAWADQYHSGFAEAMKFLDESQAARSAEQEKARAQQEHELQVEKDQAEAKAHAATARIMRRAMIVSFVLAGVAVTFGIVALWQSRIAVREAQFAALAREKAITDERNALQASAAAEQARSFLTKSAQDANQLQPIVPMALQAPDPWSIYIHVQSPNQDKEAQQVQQQLGSQGYEAPGIEHVNAGPRWTQLRFFREADRAHALEVTDVLKKLMKSSAITPQLVAGYESQARPRQLELWYGAAWFVNAGAFSNDSAAQKRRDDLTKAGFDASVVHSSDYPALTPGMSIAALGPYPTQAAADAQRDQVKSVVGDSSVKSGW